MTGLGRCQTTLPVESRGVGFQASGEFQMMGAHLKQREMTPVTPQALPTQEAMVSPWPPRCQPGPVRPVSSPLYTTPHTLPPISGRPGPALRSHSLSLAPCDPVPTSAWNTLQEFFHRQDRPQVRPREAHKPFGGQRRSCARERPGPSLPCSKGGRDCPENLSCNYPQTNLPYYFKLSGKHRKFQKQT